MAGFVNLASKLFYHQENNLSDLKEPQMESKAPSMEESMMRGRGCKAEGGETSGSWGSRPGGGLGPSCQQCGLQHSETQQ